MKRSVTMFVTPMCLSILIGFTMSFCFCGGAQGGVGPTNVPKPSKETVINKKCSTDKQPDIKLKDTRQSQPSSIISKLLSFELPKVAFGDFVLSAQKALLEKLIDDDNQQPAPANPAPPSPPCGKTSQYIKNGILRI